MKNSKKRNKIRTTPKSGMVRKERVVQGVYVISVNGVGHYYGESSDVYRRWSTHKKLLARGRHHCVRLQQAYKQLGSSAFSYTVIMHSEDKRERQTCERVLITNDPLSLNTRHSDVTFVITETTVPNKDAYRDKVLHLVRVNNRNYAKVFDDNKNLLGVEEVLPGVRLGKFKSDNQCRIVRVK